MVILWGGGPAETHPRGDRESPPGGFRRTQKIGVEKFCAAREIGSGGEIFDATR